MPDIVVYALGGRSLDQKRGLGLVDGREQEDEAGHCKQDCKRRNRGWPRTLLHHVDDIGKRLVVWFHVPLRLAEINCPCLKLSTESI